MQNIALETNISGLESRVEFSISLLWDLIKIHSASIS